MLDTLANLVSATLRLFLWLVAALLGLALLCLGLGALLVWMLIQRLRGRSIPVSLSGRFQDLGRFGAAFGRPGFGRDMFRTRSSEAPGPGASALAQRRPAGTVEDVQARDLPTDRP